MTPQVGSFRRSGSGGQHPQAAAANSSSSEAAGESGETADADANAGAGPDIDADERAGDDETRGVSHAGLTDGDVAESDRGGDAGGSDPVGVGDVDPEVLRMVREAIIEQLSDDE